MIILLCKKVADAKNALIKPWFRKAGTKKYAIIIALHKAEFLTIAVSATKEIYAFANNGGEKSIIFNLNSVRDSQGLSAIFAGGCKTIILI